MTAFTKGKNSIGIPLVVRFSKLMDAPEAGCCWEWQGVRNQSGYGMIASEGKNRSAHRVAYELFIGPIPEEMELDHLCRNRGCVNPFHLEPVSKHENMVRGDSIQAMNGRKTHCDNGHEFTPGNTRIYENRRYCRECMRAASRDYQQRRRAALKAGTPLELKPRGNKPGKHAEMKSRGLQ